MWQSCSHSLAFNTIVPKLIISLRHLGLNSLCHSIPNFMMGKPQTVWIGATLGLYTGAPHDCMLSLLLIVRNYRGTSQQLAVPMGWQGADLASPH